MYLNVDEVSTAVQNLADAFPAICQLIPLPYQSFEGEDCFALRIGTGAVGSRDSVVIVGGHHAREWGSCEICINLATDVLEAYTDGAGLDYGGKSFSALQIQRIVENLHVVIYPLVNPDGRRFSQEHDEIGGNGGWRRNRNTNYAGIGVDLNRNYDFLFDLDAAFDPAVVPNLAVNDTPGSDLYQGPSAFSENETKNVQWLLDSVPRARWFVDVHSSGQWLLYNWGDDNNQSSDAAQNFMNPAFDGTRGIKGDNVYGEYIPQGDAAVVTTLVGRMHDAIAAVRGKNYVAKQSVNLYQFPTACTSKDYAYSRHFVNPAKSKTYGLTIEWGTEFRPDWPEMELIIQDVTAGLLELCAEAPCAGGLIAITLDTPSLQFIDVPSGEETSRAVVFTIQTCESVRMRVRPPGPEVLSGPGSFSLPFGSEEPLPAADSAAPRQVRVWVSFQDADPNNVTTGTVTIRCQETGEDFVIPITANTIQQPRVASVLVLDKSASMDWNSGIPGKKRIDVLHDSAPVYVELLPDNHGIGVVAFDHDPSPVRPVDDAAPNGRDEALEGIADHQPNPNGNTAIGDGVELAHDTLEPLGGYQSKATVVFTDGHETAGKYISEVAELINERVFALGLGTADQLNPVALNQLVNNTGGYLLLTGDLAAHDDLRVEKYFSQIQAGVSNAEVVVDPEGSLLPGVERRIPFSLTAADRQATVFLLSVAPWVFDFWIETPQGAKLDPPAAQVLPGVTFTQGQRVNLYRFTLPVPLGQGAHQGTWHAVLCISKEDFKKYVSGKRVRSAAAHGIAYSVNVHAFSSLRMHAEAAQNSMEPGAKLDLRVSLTEADLPVERRAYVRADVVLPSGIAQTVALAEAAPGSFEASMIAAAPGIYQIRFRAWGTTLRGFPFTREQLRTPAVWRGGDNPPPTPPAGGSDADWCRFIECLLQQKGLAAWMEKAGFSRDELLECWKASCRRR